MMDNAVGVGWRPVSLVLFLFLATSTLIGCGGGGGSDSNPAAGSTTYYQDADGDGYGDPADTQTATSQPAGYVTDNTDCNDTDAAINPAATEVADGVDNNCNGQVDEAGGATTYYRDADGDGYGDPADTQTATSQPAGYVLDNTDCDDTSATVNPGAQELADGIDNNCDGQVDEGFVTYYQDADGDGYGDLANALVANSQPAGYVLDNTDCDDTSATVNPGAQELADGIDNNCDGQVDEGFVTYYQDADGDGYGDLGNTQMATSQPAGYVLDNTDCDDTRADANPAATEIIDGIDNNCDGNVDDVPPAAPSLSLSYQPVKLFSFSWDDVAGETEYQLFQNPDGASGYSLLTTIPADSASHDLEVHLPQRVNARYLLRACNSYGCSPDSNEVMVDASQIISAIGYFKASNTGANDYFGWSVALSADGSTLVVGARYERSDAKGVDGDQTNDLANQAGAVYVFTRNASGGWSQQAYVKASNTDPSDEFGYSIALSDDGNTLAVGAPGEDSSATGVNTLALQQSNGVYASGAAYVFVRSGSTWSQQAYVKASNTHQNYQFGWSVALSGDGGTLAVGSPGEAGAASGINGDETYTSGWWESGAVYVFARNGSSWSQQAYVKASNTDPYDAFGWSVSLSTDGNTLAVGAYYESGGSTGIGGNQADDTAQGSGAVYVFIRSGTNWSQQAYIKASNAEGQDWFGYSLALSGDGDTLAVGAIYEDSAARGIGSIQSDNSAMTSGAAYVFSRTGGTWSQQAYVKALNADPGDYFGISVSLSADGNALVVGAYREQGAGSGLDADETDNSNIEGGAVYLFIRTSGQWAQQSYIKAPNIAASRMFGYSAALSDDGDSLAVGAYLESNNATGINGTQAGGSNANSGAVYLY